MGKTIIDTEPTLKTGPHPNQEKTALPLQGLFC